MKTHAFLLFASVASAFAQTDNNLLDTFVSTFTFTTRDEANALLNVFDKCESVERDSTVFQEVLRTGLNATRTCTNEISREHARKCIDRLGTLATLSTSPYNVLAMQKLSTTDIARLNQCSTGFSDSDATVNDANIVDSVLVIIKRFVQCGLVRDDLTADQTTAILDVFKGTEQTKEVNRALLSNLCGSLHFGGEVHKDLVEFLTATFKTYVVFLPNRR